MVIWLISFSMCLLYIVLKEVVKEEGSDTDGVDLSSMQVSFLSLLKFLNNFGLNVLDTRRC